MMGRDDQRENTPPPNSDHTRKANDMLQRAETTGTAFTNELNNMSTNDQRSVFAAMKQLQARGQYQDVQLVDSDNDGLLDDASANVRGRGQRDVYDTPREAQAKQQAMSLLTQMEVGRDVTQQYNQMPPELQRNVYSAMQDLIQKEQRFSGITITDRNGDGIMDDARARTSERTADVYDTPADRRAKQATDEARQRLPEIIEGVQRGSGEKVIREIGKGLGGILKRNQRD
jgi:hypothetical protein